MLIVAGKLYVDSGDRDSYLADCHDIIEQARSSEGCLDFYLTADPFEDDRINVFEQWESAWAVERFRGSGTPSSLAARIHEAHVFQHQVASTVQL